MLRRAVVLVLDCQIEEGIEVALALSGGDRIRSPGGRDPSYADIVEHSRDDLDRGLGNRLAAQMRDARYDRIVGLGPAPVPLFSLEPAKPVCEPDFRLLTGTQDSDFGRGDGVGGVVQAAQARSCKAHLGHLEKPGQGHLHGHASFAQRLRDGLHVAVGR